jgi:hypothetical protein
MKNESDGPKLDLSLATYLSVSCGIRKIGHQKKASPPFSLSAQSSVIVHNVQHIGFSILRNIPS